MKTQTQSVCFSLTELMEWLNKMTPIADEIRIFMGDYPSADVKAGRTTVILWPYKDGEPARSTDATLAPESVEPDFGNEDEGTTSPAPGGGNPVNPYNDGKLMP
ncbi:MAG: hypothetical protein DI535_11840 [Citrobacter freundii]|nr:MAG: hypothetical protein DI535_11840 [Citrobacter freundii]